MNFRSVIGLKLVLIVNLFFLGCSCRGQSTVTTTEPICGYAAGVRHLVANQIQQGITVEMLAGEPSVGETCALRFRVVRKPQDELVDDLQVEHEKLMHLIGVSRDLGEFIHIHPQRVSPGLWQVNYAFTNSGSYQFWSDLKQRGVVYSVAHPMINVAGVAHTPPSARIPKMQDEKSGYRISLETPGELVAGQTNLLLIKIYNSEGTQIGTDFFLGAALHVVVIKEDLSVYAHGHAGNHLKGERDLYFNQVFPERGNYKIFAQFRPFKTKMPPDQAILAEFWVKVRGAYASSPNFKP